VIAAFLVALPWAAGAATPPAGEPVAARRYAEAFRDICLRSNFDPARAETMALKLGWRGRVLQRPTPQSRFTRWRMPFGDLQVGYRTMGGINLRRYDCSFTIREAAAPPAAELEAALEAVMAPALFEDLRPTSNGRHRVARIADRDNEQSQLIFSNGRVPFAEAGGEIVLRPGLLINYGRAKGPYARAMND
jgi:hypothetical protein